MPLLRINATARGLELHGSVQPIGSVLRTIRTTQQGTVIMVHGYKYSPRVAARCPHRSLFGLNGWPQTLGVSRGEPDAPYLPLVQLYASRCDDVQRRIAKGRIAT